MLGKKIHNYIPVNLQLFAYDPEDDEETLDEELETDDETEDENSEDSGDEDSEGEDETEGDGNLQEEEEEVEDEEPPKQDKKTHAIIKAKQKTKQVSEENRALKAELEKYKLVEQQKEDAKRKEDLEKSYIDEGWNEEAAKKLATQDLRLEQIERRQIRSSYERQAERLQGKFPEVWGKLNEFMDICEKTGWPLEKVCRAELEESDPISTKIKDEQAEVARRKSTPQSKPVNNVGSKLETVKLSAEDETAYKVYAKYNPGVSRKQYKQRVLDPRKKQYDD